MVIIVSEETGSISVAYKGNLSRNLNAESLELKLESIQNKQIEEKKRIFVKGRAKNETKADK